MGISVWALLSAGVSFIFALVVTPIVIRLAWKWRMVDDPKKNKHPKVIHSYPVPRGGGLALGMAIIVSALIFLPLDKHLVAILSGAVVVLVSGILDDKLNLNPYLRLGLNALAALLVVGGGIGISFITNPFGGVINLDQARINFFGWGEWRSVWIIADLFAGIWIVSLMNMVSWSSGVDGQVSGVIAIAAIVIGVLSLRSSSDIAQWPVIILAFITAGAFLGFLPFHVFPQKIMPGYSGATLGGFMLAVLAILSTAKVGTLIVVLGVPILDGVYTIVRRVLAGKSPVWGDRGHLHHKLLELGWGKRKVAMFYWGITLLLGIAALNLNSKQKLYTMLAGAIILGAFLLWVNYFRDLLKQPGRDNG